MNAASKKILIADDDSSIRLVLSQAFTRLGYQVRATGNATTLLKWVSDGEGDLVVCDRTFDEYPYLHLPEDLPDPDQPSQVIAYVALRPSNQVVDRQGTAFSYSIANADRGPELIRHAFAIYRAPIDE